jgi:hypothetical protein
MFVHSAAHTTSKQEKEFNDSYTAPEERKIDIKMKFAIQSLKWKQAEMKQQQRRMKLCHVNKLHNKNAIYVLRAPTHTHNSSVILFVEYKTASPPLPPPTIVWDNSLEIEELLNDEIGFGFAQQYSDKLQGLDRKSFRLKFFISREFFFFSSINGRQMPDRLLRKTVEGEIQH